MKLKSAIVLSLLAAGCTTIDYRSGVPADWPTLRVVEQFVPYDEVRAKCGNPAWFWTIFACMIPDFKAGTCNLYYPEGEPVYGWVRDHELEHCKGYDHPGDDELRELWRKYKAGGGK